MAGLRILPGLFVVLGLSVLLPVGTRAMDCPDGMLPAIPFAAQE